MPQVDLIPACAGDDPSPSDQPDFPPDSFFVAKDAEFDWIDRNAFIERKDSGKGGSLHPTTPLPPSASQRYSVCVKSKPSIIGLPKSQKAAYAEAKQRRPPSIHLFPKRMQASSSSSGRKLRTAPLTEPSSPKVSCIGRVRSKRDRSRRKNCQKQPEPTIKRSRSLKIHKSGFWSNFRSIFGSRGPKPQPKDDDPAAAGKLKKSRSVRKRNSAKAESGRGSICTPPADPPSLVAVKHFTSGRRSEGWAAALEVDVCKSSVVEDRE